MAIKKQIRITYLVDLDVDRIEAALEENGGFLSKETIMSELKHQGIGQRFVADFTIESVEDIEEGK